MPGLNPSAVELPSVVDEMIYIHIHDDTFIDTEFHYVISDLEKKIFRKGHFLGTRVQLRVAHLKDGSYLFSFRLDSLEACSFSFEKISGAAGRLLSRK